MPTREAVLGFLFGLGVLVIAFGFLGAIPGVIGSVLILVIFGGWIFFSIRDRRRRSA